MSSLPDLRSIELALDAVTAEALAEFWKRVGWTGMQACAADDAEARGIRTGLDRLRLALAEAGWVPR